MLSTFAQKFAIPLSFVLSLTTAPAARVKSLAAEPKRAPSYEGSINLAPTQFAMGDISKTLTNFSGSVTAIGTDTNTILVGSSTGSLNLLHASGWTEDMTAMLNLAPNESAQINAVAWNTMDGYWLVGGTVTETNSTKTNPTTKPLLMKLVPNGQQPLSLRLEAQKYKVTDITDIACKDTLCIITAAPGKVLTFNGEALIDISSRFGFMSDRAPRVASNNLVWIIAGIVDDAIDGEKTLALYLFDGKNVRLVSQSIEGFRMRALPAIALAPNGSGSAWLALAHDGALHAWVLDGSEFTPIKGFPKDNYLMPILTSTETGWIVGGGSVAKNTWTMDKTGAMTLGTHKDLYVSSMLSSKLGTFVGGVSGTSPTLIRMK